MQVPAHIIPRVAAGFLGLAVFAAASTLQIASGQEAVTSPGQSTGMPTGSIAPAGAGAEAERVIVTGSNIPTAEEVGPNPVLNLDRDVIVKSGVRTTESLLGQQPVVNSNQIPVQNNGTGQGGPSGSSAIALRGLDVNATLVLINGKRVAPFPGSSFVDLNNIPQPFIKSIEILKQGASAVYGADAVAGVVNIKTWQDFRGAQATVEYGNTLDKDAARYLGDVLFGIGDDKISINGDIFYYHHNSTFNQDRGNSTIPPFLSSNASPWNFQVSKVVAAAAGAGVAPGTNPIEFVSPTSNTNGTEPASQYLFSSHRIHVFNFNLFSSSFPEQERWGGYASFIDKVCGDQVQIYGDFMYDDSKTHDVLAPLATGSFQTVGAPVIAVPPHADLNGVAPPNTPGYAETGVNAHAYNPFNPFNQILSGGTRARIFDFGDRPVDNETEAWLTTLGIKGDKLFDGNWGYDAFFRYSQTDLISQIQTVSVPRFDQILNANSSIFDPTAADYIGTTIPYNPFTSYKQPTFASNIPLINYARANIRDLLKSQLAQTGINIYTTDLFDLPAGGVGLAIGGEWRREEFKYNPDDENKIAGNLPSRGGRKDYAFYAETTVPIFSPTQGIWGLHSVEVDASGRFEEFRNNDTNVLVPRVALRWQPFDGQLTFRAVWGEGYLESSLSELFGPPGRGLAPTVYKGNPEPDTPFEITTNKNLHPGRSRDFTSGFVYTPKWMPTGQTLTFSVDFWDIERAEITVVPSAQSVVGRFEKGMLAPGEVVQIEPVTQTVAFVKTFFNNFGKEKARGVDFSLLYQYQTPNWGTFTWTTQATYLDSVLFSLGGPTYEVSGRANNDPFEGAFFGQVIIGDGWLKWKGASTIDWTWHNFDLSWIGHYFDGFKEEVIPQLFTADKVVPHEHYVKERWFFDCLASYTVIFKPPVESQPVAGYSKGDKEVRTGGQGKEVQSTAAYRMSCWKSLLNNTTFTAGCTNVFGEDPPKAYGFENGNSNNYPGALYDNLGRFYYLRLTKKF
ncbi:MAG: iron complex outerrane recepter protein [Verrucomicrobiota bacterium]